MVETYIPYMRESIMGIMAKVSEARRGKQVLTPKDLVVDVARIKSTTLNITSSIQRLDTINGDIVRAFVQGREQPYTHEEVLKIEQLAEGFLKELNHIAPKP